MRSANLASLERMRYAIYVFLAVLLLGCDSNPVLEVVPVEGDVTFAEHIAPIVHANCTPCHRPGQAGPFDLITYGDVPLTRLSTFQPLHTLHLCMMFLNYRFCIKQI